MDNCPTRLNPGTGRQVLKKGRVGQRIGKKEGSTNILVNGTRRQLFQQLRQPIKDQLEKQPSQLIPIIIDKEGEGDNVYDKESGRKIGKIMRKGDKPRITITLTANETSKYAPVYIFDKKKTKNGAGPLVNGFWERQTKKLPRDLMGIEIESMLSEGVFGGGPLKRHARILKRPF